MMTSIDVCVYDMEWLMQGWQASAGERWAAPRAAPFEWQKAWP